ncbi:MAG: hypothetical protein WB559_07485 [Candidatus Acidiferrales bacterium]
MADHGSLFGRSHDADSGHAFCASRSSFPSFLSSGIQLHILEPSTARQVFQLDESSEKVQVDILVEERLKVEALNF